MRTRPTGPGFALAIVGVTVMMAGASAPSPFYPVLQAELGIDSGTITAVFAVYAITLLGALLTTGSLSDHLGRRPVVSAGFLLLAVSVLLFWHADATATLFAARAVQGAASGVLLSALSASIADLEPAGRPGSAALWNAVAPMAGLALGALAAGAVLDVAPEPLAAVFLPLTIAFLAMSLLAWVAPETSPRHPGWLASLRPRLGVPAHVRGLFVKSTPVVLAGWATGGLFLSLGASIVHRELGAELHLWQGLAVAALAGSGAVSAALIRSRTPRFITIYGAAALAAGTALSLLALGAHSLAAYFAAVVVAGSGFGTAFMGVLRSIIPSVDPAERAATFAALYTVSYLAFGIPAVVAGLLAPAISLGATTYGYGAVVVLLAVLAAALRWRAPGRAGY
ncbi:MFS transporter [Agromyces mediolanus]|uniref:MFS transporter n=1 Tax=Agromyces mediolanus TaxID=41986 RepID=A0A918CNZ7_AGRME|nr:MFS transporter [Agromyces mediolanus]GGR34282.1 MFS transporter [Agromyces mediolanus]GLJ74088.1 MFS transporter [Agromyces mediolanus]